MAASDASTEFSARLEAVLERISEERIKIVLQMMGASIDAGRLDQLQRALDRIPDDSPRKTAIELSRIPEQLAAVIPQAVALELDRVTPLRILGIGRDVSTAMFCAKVLGHDVTVACRKDFSNKWLLWLYQLAHFDRSRSGGLPDGRFNLIMSSGSSSLGTKQAWAEFLRPLAVKLTDDGRIFMTLARERDAKKNYHPQMVITKLAQMGARVSSRNYFVLLDQATAGKFQSGARAPIDPDDESFDGDEALGVTGESGDAGEMPERI